MTMLCTSCGVDTGIDPDFTTSDVQVIISLCENWKCDDCLYTEEISLGLRNEDGEWIGDDR